MGQEFDRSLILLKLEFLYELAVYNLTLLMMVALSMKCTSKSGEIPGIGTLKFFYRRSNQ